MNLRSAFVMSVAALGGLAGLAALRAGGQQPPDAQPGPARVVEVGPDNVIVEGTPDGRILRTTRHATGEAENWITSDGRTFYTPGAGRYGVVSTPPDPETQKLLD